MLHRHFYAFSSLNYIFCILQLFLSSHYFAFYSCFLYMSILITLIIWLVEVDYSNDHHICLTICRIYISDEDITFWEENQVSPVLTIDSMRDLVYIFVNGQFTGVVLCYNPFCALSLTLSQYTYAHICVSVHVYVRCMHTDMALGGRFQFVNFLD